MWNSTHHCIDIVPLGQLPNVIHELAQRHQQEWRKGDRDVSVARREQRLRSHLHNQSLPNTWVALEGPNLVGSVSLIDYVRQNSRDASAWVANLFVVPRLRRCGLGARLLAFVENQGKTLNLHHLFLFTPNCQDFYRHHGWGSVQQARVQGQWVEVMRKQLLATDDQPMVYGQENSLYQAKPLHRGPMSRPPQAPW